MLALRTEVLRYMYEYGRPIAVDKGWATQQVRDDLAELGGWADNTMQATISQMTHVGLLKRGDGVRHKKNQYLALTDIGRRELAVRLMQAGEDVPDDLMEFIRPSPVRDEPEPVATNNQDKLTEMHPELVEAAEQQAAEDQSQAIEEGQLVVDGKVIDDTHPEVSTLFADSSASPIDYRQLAAAVLRELAIRSPGEEADKRLEEMEQQWVDDVERLEYDIKVLTEKVAARESIIHGRESTIDRLNRRVTLLTEQNATLHGDLERMRINLGETNAEAENLRRALRRMRDRTPSDPDRRDASDPAGLTYQIIDELTEDKQRELYDLARTMQTPPRPGGNE